MAFPQCPEVCRKYVEAVTCAQQQQWHVAADAYLACYLLPRCREWSGWHSVWSGFTAILRQNIRASPAHMAALKRVAKDKARPKLHRAMAYFTRGLSRFEQRDREGAASDYRESLAVARAATAAERSANVLLEDARRHTNVGVHLDGIVKDCESNLAVLVSAGAPRPPSRNANATSFRPADSEHPAGHNLFVGVGPVGDPEANLAAHAAAVARLSVGGDTCDRCGGSGREGAALKRCGACRTAYYCSSQCQQEAWRAGHKQACRKPGMFREGDMVLLHGLVNRPELNGSVRVIVGPTEGERIVTNIIGGDAATRLALKPVNLRQLRPAA